MKKLAKRLTVIFSAGCLGGLANSLAVWLFGAYGVTKALGVRIAPDLSPIWLLPPPCMGRDLGIAFPPASFP